MGFPWDLWSANTRRRASKAATPTWPRTIHYSAHCDQVRLLRKSSYTGAVATSVGSPHCGRQDHLAWILNASCRHHVLWNVRGLNPRQAHSHGPRESGGGAIDRAPCLSRSSEGLLFVRLWD